MYQPLPDIIYVYSILCDLKVIAKKVKIRLPQKLVDIRYLCKWTTNLFLGLKLRAKDLYVQWEKFAIAFVLVHVY